VTYVLNSNPGSYIDILSNFLTKGNAGPVKIGFDMMEVPSSGYNYYSNALKLSSSLFNQLIGDLEDLPSLQNKGAQVDFTYLPDKNDQSTDVYVPLIHIIDNDKLVSPHPIKNHPLPQHITNRHNVISQEISRLLIKNYNRTQMEFSRGWGGVNSLNIKNVPPQDSHMDASLGVFLV
jgi:hypothetical protein